MRDGWPGLYMLNIPTPIIVINRGNAGEDIFKNDREKEKFLQYLPYFPG